MHKAYSVTEEELIEKCKTGDEYAMHFLYDRYKNSLMGVCMRYMKDPVLAEDILIESFYKIITKIDQYSGNGSFEGWMKRICVNEALMYLRKRKKTRENKADLNTSPPRMQDGAQMMIDNEILALLDELPEGYRTVFNLYVIEGFKHREIAEKLDISINTSKSQLIMARKRLREKLEDLNYPGISNYL